MPNSPEKPSLFAHLHAILLVVALADYVLASFFAIIPAIHGLADEHGYLTTARQLALRHTFAQVHADPYAFVGETFMQSPADADTYYLRQPIGYPVLCAAAYAIGGPDAPFYVNAICGLALIAAVYAIGRQLGQPLPAAIAAFFIATHPIILYYTIKPLSHLPDMAFSAWAMAVLLRWRQKGGAGWPILGGALLGIATMIRYTNVLLLIPFTVIVAERMRDVPREQKGPRRGIILQALAAPGAMAVMLIPLLMYHAAAFGSIFRTGYSAGGNATSFSLGWFFEHAPAMGEILTSPSTGLSLLLLAVAAGMGILGARRPFVLAILLAWALPSLILYAAYYGKAGTNMLLYARFALASFVPLLLLAVVWLGEMRPRLAQVLVAVVAVLAGGAMALGLSAMLETNADLQRNLVFCDSAAALLRKNVPTGSVIFAENDLQYEADYAGNYIVYAPSMYTASDVAQRVADLQQTPHEFDPAHAADRDAAGKPQRCGAPANPARPAGKLHRTRRAGVRDSV